jgi:signal transduction histidine kinase
VKRLRPGWLQELARDTEAARTRRRILARITVLLVVFGFLEIAGERAGWYSSETGMALMILGAIAMIAVLFGYGARVAHALEARDHRYAARLRILHEVDRGLVRHETPEAIAQAALTPLRDLLGVPRAIVNLIDVEKGEVEWLAAVGRQRFRAGGVRYPLALMGDVDGLKRGEPQVIDTEALPPSPHRDALLASGVRIYMALPMIVAGELIGALSFGGESGEFPEEQVEIAREVATQLALAVMQARMRSRIERHAADLEEKVRERTAELELLNKELEAFSYTVSHDLRSPLRAVDGFARIFEEDYGRQVDEEGRRLLSVIRESSRRMGVLIDNLLAFSMLGRQALRPASVDMTQLAAEAWVELGDNAVQCNLPPLPEAMGDRMLLKQVWSNLLGNAVKYSAKREAPRVEVSGSVNGQENVYCVSDNGAGFDMRYYGKLFGVFQRLHSAGEFSGTGVGLAIVQRIVARHGGRVWGEGRPGAGATFHFRLPAGDAQ